MIIWEFNNLFISCGYSYHLNKTFCFVLALISWRSLKRQSANLDLKIPTAQADLLLLHMCNCWTRSCWLLFCHFAVDDGFHVLNYWDMLHNLLMMIISNERDRDLIENDSNRHISIINPTATSNKADNIQIPPGPATRTSVSSASLLSLCCV